MILADHRYFYVKFKFKFYLSLAINDIFELIM